MLVIKYELTCPLRGFWMQQTVESSRPDKLKFGIFDFLKEI